MGRYDDIINLEHPTSKTHPRMSAIDRAAQFAPFAALTGFSDVIDDAASENEGQYDITLSQPYDE